MFANFVVHFKEYLYVLADLSASLLELIAILIITLGACRALVRLLRCAIKKQPCHIVIDLGKALSLALEFKVGAEIIKTVIIHNLEELAILGVVILIHALLAFIVYWEIRNGNKGNSMQKSELQEDTQDTENA